MMCSHRTLFARCLRWLTQRYAITRSFIALFVAMPAGLLFNFQETTQEKQENKKKNQKNQIDWKKHILASSNAISVY